MSDLLNHRKFSILTTSPFLLGLGLLLLNDLFLKYQFHNWITGKLSDFAGLFIFPIFWAVFFPKYKNAIFSLTGLGFIIWKSPISQPLIDLWNISFLFSIQRVIDYSDLLALLILPIAYVYYDQSAESLSLSFPLKILVSALCILAFIATSRPRTPEETAFHRILQANNPYQFQIPPKDLMGEINKEFFLQNPFVVSKSWSLYTPHTRVSASGKIPIIIQGCEETVFAHFAIVNKKRDFTIPGSRIALWSVTDCVHTTPEEFRSAFEEQFIVPLRKKLSLDHSIDH